MVRSAGGAGGSRGGADDELRADPSKDSVLKRVRKLLGED